MSRRYYFPPGTVRWFRWDGSGDVRGHRTAAGWHAEAMIIDRHPITYLSLPQSQWWIKETKDED